MNVLVVPPRVAEKLSSAMQTCQHCRRQIKSSESVVGPSLWVLYHEKCWDKRARQ